MTSIVLNTSYVHNQAKNVVEMRNITIYKWEGKITEGNRGEIEAEDVIQ